MSYITITQKQYDLVVEAAESLRKLVNDEGAIMEKPEYDHLLIEALKNLSEFLLAPSRI